MQRAEAVAADRRRPAPVAAGPPAARLSRFVLERFPPASYGALTLALVLCGAAGAALDRGEALHAGWSQAGAALAAWLVFLQLRALDELRDEAVDRLARPDRPLARGLVSRTELRALALAAAVAGLATTVSLGPVALAWYGIAAGQVWLLDLGADRGPAALRGMVAIALLHSGIVPAVLLVAWAPGSAPGASVSLAATLALAWAAGLALEVGRKTVSVSEERPGLATYSGVLGRARALALVAVFLAVTGTGAAVLAFEAGASTMVAVLPLALAAAAPVVLVGGRDRISTHALRAGVPLAVLAALLWPVALAWGVR